jgi:CoA:oxalate CoA-transferase
MKPLEGVTVIDITRVVAGPFCSMLFADMGATVIKVEDPQAPDYTRDFPPFIGKDEEDTKFSAFFAQYNRNKLGVSINLREEEGKQLLKKLVSKADILIENFRPGVMSKLGVGYETLKEINPKLVYTAISGYGQNGPYVKRPAYDNSAQATGGLWSMNGLPDQPPVRVGTIIGDLSASLFAAFGTLTAYIHAKDTGEGQMVDVGQLDSVLALTETAVVNYTVSGEIQQPLGNQHPFVRPYELFNCADGYIFFGGYTDKFWRVTCEYFGEPEFAELPEINTMDKRFDNETYQKIVKPKLDEWFSKYTAAELENGLGEKVPLSPIKNIAQVVEDPQIRARDMIISSAYPGGVIEMFGLPIKLSTTPGDPSGPAPKLGEHNEKIYSELLGLTNQELIDLKRNGVI